MKATCRDGGWAVRAEPSLLLNTHFNQEQPLASSLEVFWTFSVRNHPFCLGMAKADSWERSICGNGWGEGLEWLSTLSYLSQSWHPHRWLWWQGGVGVVGHWAAHGSLQLDSQILFEGHTFAQSAKWEEWCFNHLCQELWEACFPPTNATQDLNSSVISSVLSW